MMDEMTGGPDAGTIRCRLSRFMRPELVRATDLLRSNDAAHLNEALALLQDTVYSFSMKLCGHHQDAEDTAQEVFVRSLPHLSKLHDPKAMSVWLYTVAKNRCWRMRRKTSNAPSRNLSLEELMPDSAELQRLLADTHPTPEASVAQAQESERLHAAILTLPPQYRLVLVLHDMEELDTEVVAKILGVKPGTVRVRLHRARLALRRELARADVPATSAAAHPPARTRSCHEIFASLSDYLDGHIDAAASSRMRSHIEACAPCIAFLQDLRRAIERCQKAEQHCAPEIRSRLRSLLEHEKTRIAALPALPAQARQRSTTA